MRLARRVERLEHDEGRGYVRVLTDAVEIRLMFLRADVLRIRAGFDGGFAEESYSLVTTAWEDRLDPVLGAERTRVAPGRLAVQVTTTGWVVTGSRLQIQVDRDPFRLTVLDADGTVLHADVAELGYREDLNGRRIHTTRIAPDDCFYGFGETTGPLNKAGRRLTLDPRDAMGYDPQLTDPLYKHIPFFIRLGRSTRVAVGYFYHNTYPCEFDLGRSRSNYWPPYASYRTDGGDVDLFLIAGPTIREVISRYTGLTGRPAMLPRSALGYLGSSMYYSELPRDCDEAILGFVDAAERHGIPLDGFQLSSGYTQQETADGLRRCVLTWNEERFPDPSGLFARMVERGVTVSPNVKPGVLRSHPDVADLSAEGIFVRDAGGDEPATGMWWGGPGHLVDFTSPRAREVWRRRLTDSVLTQGTTSVWNDNCEYDSLVDLDARCDFEGVGGTIGRLKPVMANLMCQVTRHAVEEHDADARPFVVCRSGHAGIQRYAQTWSGDNATSWESLEHNVATMLGMSLSGVANQGTDIGGFSGPAPGAELLVRWVQHGVFQPRFSIHSANTDNTVTEPWMYADRTDLVREAVHLRYRLFPYFYALMARAHRTGMPIVEPMCSAFQHDPATYDESVDMMLGDALLIASVVRPGVTSRSVYLPEGEQFFDLTTRTSYRGGQTVELDVDMTAVPVLLRAGGIVPMAAHQVSNVTREPVTALRLVCAPQRDGEFVLYEDDGLTRAFERGEWLQTRIVMRAGRKVELELTHTGPFESTVERLTLDLVHPEGAPSWVTVDGEHLPRLLDREAFERATLAWYYSQTLGSVLVSYPNPRRDHLVAVSFEELDLIGM